jgi:hypothetical protein
VDRRGRAQGPAEAVRDRRRGVVLGVDGVSDFDAIHSRFQKHTKIPSGGTETLCKTGKGFTKGTRRHGGRMSEMGLGGVKPLAPRSREYTVCVIGDRRQFNIGQE